MGWSWTWTSTWLGDLITVASYNAGGFYEYNPLYFGQYADDEVMKKECCLFSNNCGAFFKARPLDNCVNFRPPAIRETLKTFQIKFSH